MGNTDYFGVKAEILNTKKLFLLDMDGTIYKEEELFSGTIETLTEIDKLGGTYIFITNNSSKSVSDYIEKMKKWGFMWIKIIFLLLHKQQLNIYIKIIQEKWYIAKGHNHFWKNCKKKG